MKIRFVGARPREVVSAGRSFTVQPGGEYEVPDRLGAAMCEQRWFEPVDQADEPQVEPEHDEPVDEQTGEQPKTKAPRKESAK